jgi:hypothetical protein
MTVRTFQHWMQRLAANNITAAVMASAAGSSSSLASNVRAAEDGFHATTVQYL